MAVTSKKRYYFIIALICAALFIGSAVFFGTAANAESTPEAESGAADLTPVGDLSDIAYRYLEMPTSVYADGAGLIIGGELFAETFVNETEFVARKAIPAQKIMRHGEHGDHAEYTLALYNGVITVYNGDTTSELETSGIIDFDIYNDTLYAITSSDLITVPLGADMLDIENKQVSKLVSDRHTRISAKAITVSDGTVYVAVASVFGSKNDICTVSGDTLDIALMQSDIVIALSSCNGDIYALTRNDLVRYSPSAVGGLNRLNVTDGSQLTAIYAYNGQVYALDTLNSVHRYSYDLTADKILIASSGATVGFLDMPSGASVKYSKLYVADTLNNRIAVYGDKISYADRTFVNPIGICYDSAGTAYVAYDYNKVGIFDGGNLDIGNERTVTDPEFGRIKQIAVDTDKTLYILSDSGLWCAKHGETPTIISERKIKYITLSMGRDELYALACDGVYKIDKTSLEETLYCGATSDAIAAAVDLNGTAFILYGNRISRITDAETTNFPLVTNGESYAIGGNTGAMFFSSVSNTYVSHGDIIIVDSYKHRIFKTGGTALGAKLIDDSYKVPDLANNNELAYYGTRIIRTALRDAEVFVLPMETQPIFTISSGRKVIVPLYALEETPEYSFVLIDDVTNGKLVQGYVYKDALSEPLAYTAPPSSVGTVFNAATPIYKWPSRNAQAVKGFTAVNQNTEFKMLEFVESYRDDYGYNWYRVQLDSKYEGYILGINLSLMSYEPVFIRPAYNAEIISYKGSAAAPVYILQEGIYTQIAELPTGTQVEVVGAFDTSEKYTLVKYLDPSLGTLTCYVETVYLKYNGVNIVLIVAVAVIVITVILASIIIVRTVRSRKKRIEGDTD